MIFSLSCLVFYSARNEKIFSHLCRWDDLSVFCLGFKSHFVQVPVNSDRPDL